MANSSASVAVANLIALAAKKTGWSIAKLNRHLGKGENTLHRWRTGKMENFELAALIELCRLAEVGMDDAFGVTHKVTAQAEPDNPPESATGMERRMAKLEQGLQAIQPLVQIVDGFSALIARQMTKSQSQTRLGPSEAAGLTTTGIIAAIEQEHATTGGVRQRATDFEKDQIQEKA